MEFEKIKNRIKIIDFLDYVKESLKSGNYEYLKYYRETNSTIKKKLEEYYENLHTADKKYTAEVSNSKVLFSLGVTNSNKTVQQIEDMLRNKGLKDFFVFYTEKMDLMEIVFISNDDDINNKGYKETKEYFSDIFKVDNIVETIGLISKFTQDSCLYLYEK